MNIPSAGEISGIQQAATQQKIDIALMAKANQVAKSQGEAALQLLDAAVQATESAGDGHHGSDGHKLNVIA